MTRLITQMIADIPTSLVEYDRLLKQQTGCSLLELAAKAAGQDDPIQSMATSPVAIVPITAGEGMIPGFCEAVQAIAAHLGFSSRITENRDVEGFAEAIDSRAEIVLMADDSKFVAFNVTSGKCTDNSEATGLAFTTALDLAAGGLTGKKVAVLGLGPVGTSAVSCLIQLNALPLVYDPDPECIINIQQLFPVQTAMSVADCLIATPFVIDATPVANIISADFISADSLIANPGVPHGLTMQALEKLDPIRFIHDPLQLGVSVMLLTSLKNAKAED